MNDGPSHTEPAPPPPPAAGSRPRRLVRSRRDQMLGGVAAGLADYLDADPSIIRIGWAALTLVTGGAAALAYLAAWLLIPEEGDDDLNPQPAATVPGERPRHRQRRRGSGGIVWGLVLIAIGVVVLVGQLDLPTPPWRALAAGALILIGLGIAAGSRRGLNGGLTAFAVLLTLVLAAGVRFPMPGLDSGFGDRRETVTTAADLQADYGHAFGAMRIEVASAALPAGTTRIETSIAFGELRLTVPEGIGVRVTANTAFGSTRVFDEETSALATGRVTTSPGYDQAEKRLDVTVNTAFGSSRIMRGQP